MTHWIKSVALFRQPRVIGILFLGFSSGLPFLLTLGTLQAWLIDSNISNTIIGLFAFATIPYAFKFLWAPLADHLKIPWLYKLLGQRRSWILVSQLGLVISLVLLGMTKPNEHIFLTAIAAFAVSFFAAFQDNAIEAYRIELLPREQLGPGASASVLGFRIGMWVSGGGALYLAHLTNNWFFVYYTMALCLLAGMCATLLMPNPKQSAATALHHSFILNLKKNMIPAVISVAKQPEFSRVLVFIFLFKIGDSVLNMISIPFLRNIGFSLLEIANIAKTFGIVAMIAGGLFAGLLQVRKPPLFCLGLSAMLLALSSIMFTVQATLGHNIQFLILTMGVENFACGMSATALISFLSSLCHRPNTATHYAIFSSFSSLSRVCLSIGAGWLADRIDWINYFALVSSLCLLSLLWLIFHGQQIASYYRRESKPPSTK